MPALASELRKTLETTVVDARDKAERGARDALTALAVAASEPYSSMSEDERKLRNRLRARGRQLGDQRDPQKGTQSIERLVREMAYEHWHRMLFARFLAENQLLIEPSSGVAITLDECEELAAEEGTDLWGVAAQFAQEMLPQIFRTDDPVLALRLPLEIRQQLQGLVAELAIETFTASDSLGWTYQFWQTKRKKEVNDSGVKIGADELSPVTQLFTEDYMVDFLLDNTLGSWHAARVLAANPELARTAQTEDDLRQAVALPGCSWSYLRFVKSDDGTWAPAAGPFEGWPLTAAELKCLDPCMGSGHFVVAMFERLVALRIAKEGLNEKAAVAAVIEENLFGLEIDPRCTQIAAFNLALAAWRRVGHCKLPAMNLACSGLAPNAREADWLEIAGDDERLRNGMERLYRLFQKASVLGSLINPVVTGGDLLMAPFNELQPLLNQVVEQENHDNSTHEMAVAASGLAKAAEILAGKFILVATNVPYLGLGRQEDELQTFCIDSHSDAQADLASCFLERCLEACDRMGVTACVTPQNWLFLKDYKKVRKKLLTNNQWIFSLRLGAGAFETISGEVVKASLVGIAKQAPQSNASFLAADISGATTITKKRQELKQGNCNLLRQSHQLLNPSSVVTSETLKSGELLQKVATSFEGAKTVDIERFRHLFWELSEIRESLWWPHNSSPNGEGLVSGCHYVSANRSPGTPFQRNIEVYEKNGKKVVAWQCGSPCWGKKGVAVSWMNNLPASIYLGTVFDNSAAVIMPESEDNLPAVYCFIRSGEYTREIRKINQKVQVAAGTLDQVPFDLDHWSKIAAEKYPRGLPSPYSSDPSQWIFDGHPINADHPLHVATARLVGYLWPRQTGSSFLDCPALEPDGLRKLADEDGIVCLSPIRGEASAADRLRMLLGTAFGDEWSNAKERELLLETALANNAKKAAADLDDWLRQNFFAEHCKIFKSRPFIWHIWDGNPRGFSALVNYHKLAAPSGQGRKTLELLTHTYLGDWIDRQKLDQAEGVNGADDRLAAALDLQGQLKKILEGEPPYDIFVRWKPLHQQSIGWDPDINDGVRLNIRPFLKAQLRKGGRKNAGILRWKPFDIKRKADRGKEPMRSKEVFPWFWGWDENNTSLAIDYGAPISEAASVGDSFDGNRWNDLHYTRAAKEAARARHRGEA